MIEETQATEILTPRRRLQVGSPPNGLTLVELPSDADGAVGLSSAEAERRRSLGQGNDMPVQSSRPYRLILRENIFTLPNTSLFALSLALVVLGRPTDVLVSFGVVLLNVVTSVLQEVRAKRKLDRIALLSRPTATVLRDGREQTIDPALVVLGDVLIVRPGDQVVADGHVIGPGHADMDESLLTGESEVVAKQAGDILFAGSYCVNGSAMYQAERVGPASMASQITVTARAFRRIATPLQQYVGLVVRVILLAAIFIEVLLIGVTLIYNAPALTIVQNSVVVVGLVPQGLFLSIAVAYAMGAVRVAGRAILVQQSNAIESLSNVDILCLDKTGTLTTNRIRLSGMHPLGVPGDVLTGLLGDFARSVATPNQTSRALAEGCAGSPRRVIEEVPFASERKWSGLIVDDTEISGTYILGAPEILQPFVASPAHLPGLRKAGAAPDSMLAPSAPAAEWDDPARMGDVPEAETWDMLAEAWADKGLRVLLFARADFPGRATLHAPGGEARLPERLLPLGLVIFSDELRPDAADTLARFAAAGIEIKVISGDSPHTVAALARQAGLSADLRTISGQKLSTLDDDQFAAAAESNTVFGRVTPQQKEQLVQALKQRGHYVAMTGDGINDVMALKQAHLGIAMETGSQASRAVADIVLLDNSFAALPAAFEEGQRIRNGMQDVLKLFLTRLLVVVVLVGAVGFVGGFAFTPKQVSLVGFLTVGIPTVVLAMRAGIGTASTRTRIVEVFHFVLPAGLSLAMTSLTTYLVVLYLHSRTLMAQSANLPHAGALAAAVPAAQSGLATILVLCGLILVPFVVPPTRSWRRGGMHANVSAAQANAFFDWRPTAVAAALVVVYGLTVATPALGSFFELTPLSLLEYALITCQAVIWALLLRWAWRSHVLERYLYDEPPPPLASGVRPGNQATFLSS